MAGRKPLPVAVKKIKGTLQKCRTNPNEPRPQGKLGDPPEYMSDIAKEAWTYVRNVPTSALHDDAPCIDGIGLEISSLSHADGVIIANRKKVVAWAEVSEIDRTAVTSSGLNDA